MLPGFARGFTIISASAGSALVLISRSAGTNRGNLTGSGGLAASFDGDTNQSQGSSSTLSGVSSGWVGKTLATPKRFGQARLYGANNAGFWSTNPSTTITMYGKTGAAPSNGTDGTAIGSVTFTDTADDTARVISSTDLSTPWDHVFANITRGDASTGTCSCAELELWEWA